MRIHTYVYILYVAAQHMYIHTCQVLLGRGLDGFWRRRREEALWRRNAGQSQEHGGRLSALTLEAGAREEDLLQWLAVATEGQGAKLTGVLLNHTVCQGETSGSHTNQYVTQDELFQGCKYQLCMYIYTSVCRLQEWYSGYRHLLKWCILAIGMIKEGAYMYVHVYMYYVHVYIHVYTCIYIYCCQKLRTYNRIYNYSRANILYSRERTVNFLYIQLSASKIHVYIFSRILQIKISDSGRIFVKKEKEILAWLLTPAA